MVAFFRYAGHFMKCLTLVSRFFSMLKIDWREVVDNLFLQNDPAREKILLSEAVFGKFQIGSAAKCSNFGEFQNYFIFFAHLVIHILGAISSYLLGRLSLWGRRPFLYRSA